MTHVVVGIGNEYRQDDGIGLVVAEQIERRDLPDVRVVSTDGEPSRMIEAWSGADVAVVVDAVRLTDPNPGRVHRMLVGDLPGHVSSASSHGLGVPEAVELARVLDRLPGRLVLFTVEVQETGFGVGLSDPVAAAVGDLVDAVLRELANQPSSPPRESS
jgi:hydrogenase maturation protease